VSPALPNPERLWSRVAPLATLDRSEIERRLGPIDGALEVLSGGLANTNVRIGADRVLRIYRRDPRSAPKEATLLRRGWRTFRVPRLLDAGNDFLLLEFVAHAPLEGGAAQGAACGRALAEVHGLSFERAGFLDASLTVAEPFADLVGTLHGYARSCLDSSRLDERLRTRVVATLERHEGSLRELAGRPVLLHADWKASNLHESVRGELLVLDWEFAYAGAALSDVGQLLRWSPPRAFVEALGEGYRRGGGVLPDEWERWAAAFDIFNLAGLVSRPDACEECTRDVSRRLNETLEVLA
jgi:hypothetical protein